ncbi:MAG TPA: ATP-binding domain-containing protein [Acidimicrobiales bacterium]|nr:ATP-binding domain-containing protein [Acidimicrobiales bacterium]
MPPHPELAAEQAVIDRAYASLQASREAALRLRSMVEVGQGGTDQARWEREVINENVAHRLKQLHVGDASLVFGRIDQAPDAGGGSYYIGRVSVSDEDREPLVVDWRAPVSESFYRATGREPLGLVRRRHFASRGRTLLGIEDELFGDAAARIDTDGVSGQGALIAALESARTGRLGDIVATIQGEQDEIIRAPLPGVLVVQGGPGTGKTVVALHRAAYLLYTHRFPLEGQGVLVVGPNRLFLGYIEQVLPSLGEAGVELAVLADLIDEVRLRGSDRGLTARVKGDLRMTGVIARAVRDRERGLRRPLRVGYGLGWLTMSVERSEHIVADARRRYRTHNAARRFVENEVFAALAESGPDGLSGSTVRDRLRGTPEVREALEWMWPLLRPTELLHDLFGSPALLRSASRGRVAADLRSRRTRGIDERGGLTDDEWRSLHRPRSEHADQVVWVTDDVPLLDEAHALLGPRSKKVDGEVRTYGHIVVDEAQDLSPMALRVLARRSLNGSMTIVGDIAQATGAWAHLDWNEVLELLPGRREPRRVELTVGYRIPAPLMSFASRALTVAAPDLTPPRSIRTDGDPPRLVRAPSPEQIGPAVVDAVRHEVGQVGSGNVAVICPAPLVDLVCQAFDAAEVPYGRATRSGLDTQITVVPVGLVKGLEVDASVVVEPATIVADEPQGHRALYVALTRATKRLALVHGRELPDFLRE